MNTSVSTVITYLQLTNISCHSESSAYAQLRLSAIFFRHKLNSNTIFQRIWGKGGDQIELEDTGFGESFLCVTILWSGKQQMVKNSSGLYDA